MIRRSTLSMLAVMFVLAAPISALAQSGDTIEIKLYFANERFNPNQDPCNMVFPVTRRIPRTRAVATAALVELFKGPTKEEEAAQYSGFPASDTAGILKSVNVVKGAAYVNFTERMYVQMGTATTSCGGAAFFSMVEKTLKQFPTITKVFYAIERNPRDFYDWVQAGECPKGLRNCDNRNFK